MYETVEVHMAQLETAAPILRDLSIVLKLEVLAEFRNEVVRRVRMLNPKAIFKKSSGRLLQSIYGLVIADRVVFYSTERHFGPQEQGVKPHTMWYLLGKTIPLRKEGAKTLFRKCTLKSLIRGGWRHPGYEGKHFVGGAIEDTLSQLPAMVRDKIYRIAGVRPE